jgi:hypothetical protein
MRTYWTPYRRAKLVVSIEGAKRLGPIPFCPLFGTGHESK